MATAKIITISNQKGGVGKTTSTMNLGAALNQHGKRVLLIDSDPQANLTSYLGVVPGEGEHERLRTLDEVFLAKRPVKDDGRSEFIAQTESGMDLVASDTALAGVEYYLISRTDKEMVLSQFLRAVAKDYDFILIDTPPSLNLLTLNALCASDSVLIPVQPEFFSLEGIVKIQDTVENVKSRWNSRLEILGVLPTQVSGRRKLTSEVLEALKSEMGEILFDSRIRENAAVTESSGHGRSVLEYQKRSNGAQDYLAAGMELLRRCDPADFNGDDREGADHA